MITPSHSAFNSMQEIIIAALHSRAEAKVFFFNVCFLSCSNSTHFILPQSWLTQQASSKNPKNIVSPNVVHSLSLQIIKMPLAIKKNDFWEKGVQGLKLNNLQFQFHSQFVTLTPTLKSKRILIGYYQVKL